MARTAKRCTVAYADITFDGTGAAVAASWVTPRTVDAAAPTAMELERAPKDISYRRTVRGAAAAEPTITATAVQVTATPGNGTDTGTIRVKGAVQPNER